jgi:type IV pilus assembly protein PilW
VRGVDSFQVLYGLDTDSPADGVPNQFLNARAIGALDAALPPLGATAAERARSLERRSHWRRVVAVRVALLLHGEAGSRQGSLPTSYELFGDSVPGDSGTRIDEATLPRALQLRVRRVFSTTVALRNTQVPP